MYAPITLVGTLTGSKSATFRSRDGATTLTLLPWGSTPYGSVSFWIVSNVTGSNELSVGDAVAIRRHVDLSLSDGASARLGLKKLVKVNKNLWSKRYGTPPNP